MIAVATTRAAHETGSLDDTGLVSAVMTDQRQPISWLALEKGTPVVAADGEEVGKVREVIADEQKDIFSGVTVDTGLLSEPRFVPAEMIDEMAGP